METIFIYITQKTTKRKRAWGVWALSKHCVFAGPNISAQQKPAERARNRAELERASSYVTICLLHRYVAQKTIKRAFVKNMIGKSTFD